MPQAHPSRWTRPLQVATTICSIVFTIGTTLQNFVIVNRSLMENAMQRAGQTAAEAEADAPGFLLGFHLVGCLYIVGNAIGIFAIRDKAWIFWVVLAVNVTQAAGVVAVPPEFFDAARDKYGMPGMLPSIVTDGGAFLLSLVLIASFAKYRTSWAYRKDRAAHPGQ